MIGPARRGQGDEAVLLDLIFDKIHTKALVDTGASDCFMAVEFRARLPHSCIQDKWEVEKGTIRKGQTLQAKPFWNKSELNLNWPNPPFTMILAL